jgi:hypothetical protein
MSWCVHKDRQCRCDWRTIDQPASADAIARYAWRRRIKQLQRGFDIWGEALLSRTDSTDDGWRDRLATRGHLSGKLARRSFRLSGQIDEDCNP